MGKNNRWLKARKRHQILIAKIQRIAGGSLIAALIVGPLIYFSVVAMPLEMRDDSQQAQSQEIAKDVPPTGEIGIASTPELRISSTPIPLPTEDPREVKIIAKSAKTDLQLEPVKNKFEAPVPEIVESIGGDLSEAEEVKFESFFSKQDVQIKKIKIGEDLPQTDPIYDPLLGPLVPEIEAPQLTSAEANKNRENDILIIDDLILEDGPSKINKKDDAEKTAEKALQKYLRSELKSADFRIFNDTSILDKNKKPYQFVLSTVKQNNGKWYVTYQQYSNALPVFDGDLKLIFTDEKKLLAISDNIKRDLPDESEFVIGKAVVTENIKEIFEWDDSIDEIEFIDKGYFEGRPAYRASTNAHDPLGDWEIFVDGIEGDVESMTSDIRLQDLPSTPQVDYSSTPEPVLAGTGEPQIKILDALFSQILGTIYPQTPDDALTTEPLSSAYTYIDTTQYETDYQGYFENASMEWYSTFLDGPNVTIHDDDATSNMEIVNQTPEAPFVWDDNSASLAAINAFYHTNKIHDYFVNNHGYEVGKNVPLTVNSTLVDAYIDGCGAWFNNTEKTIEMGRGGTPSCPAELNYALGSDMVYHEYAHFIVEDITHLPNILGAESAAMGEAFADYFAASINDDPMWGDVISPARRRNLENTLNYNNDMLGESHHDGMILSGALWDLRTEIGQEATDELVFNTLFQDRYHFETFMYGMIIEDDDNDDFSDGTPHLIEIITAFDNHGIGPGIANFNGLPLTPEAWIELFGEEPPEGEEDPIIGALSGDCDSGSGTLTIANGNTCTITGGTYTYTTGSIEGSLVLQSSANVTFTGAVVIYGTGRIYNRGASSLTISGTTYVYGGAYFYSYQQASSSHAAVTVYATGTFQAGSANDGGYITLSDHLYVSGTVRTSYDGLSAYYNSTITSSSGMTVYSTGTVEFDGRGTSSFSGEVDIQGTGGSLTVQNTGTLDVNNNFYVDTGNTLTVDSGGNMDTNHLYAGDADGSPLGGAVTINGDLDVIFNFYLFDGGVLTVGSIGSVTANYFYIGDNVDGFPMGGHVENDGYINVATYTYLMENTGGTSEGDFDNNNGGWFQTNRLYMGQNAYNGGDYTNSNGGYTDITGYLLMYNDAYYYNGANYVYNIEGTVANYIRIHDGGYLYNAINSEVYQDYSSGYFIMYDDSVVNNYGTLDINGYLTIDQTVTITLARRPEINNYGTVQVASYVSLTDYSRFSNGSISYAGTLDVEGDLNMYDSTTFENSLAGAYTGNVYIYDDLYMEDNAQFHNYDYVLLDDGGTDTGEIYLTGSADFYNQESDAILRSDDTSSTSTGLARLYWTSSIVNYGGFDVHELKIGDEPTSTGGGTLFNESGGSASISTSGTTMIGGIPTATVFNGLIHNKSGATGFWSYGLMTLENGATGGFQLNYDGQTGSFTTGQTLTGQTSGATGTISYDVDNGAYGIISITNVIGDFINNEVLIDESSGIAYANGVVYTNAEGFIQDDNSGYVGAISVKGYGLLDVNSGATLRIYGNGTDSNGDLLLQANNGVFENDGSTYVYGTTTMKLDSQLHNDGYLSIGTSSSSGILHMPNGNPLVTNNGTILIYDDLLMMPGEPEDNANGTIENDGTITVSGSTTNEAIIHDGSTFNNNSGAEFNVNSASGVDTDGILHIYDVAGGILSTLTNDSGVVRSRVLNVGHNVGSINGGKVVNNNTGEIRTYTTSLTGNHIFDGELESNGSSTITCNNNGGFYLYGGSSYGVYDYNSSGTSTCGFMIWSRGYADISAGTNNAVSCRAFETTSGYDGYMLLGSNSAVNCSEGYIGAPGVGAGYISNYGNLAFAGTLYIYEDASGANDMYELRNMSSGSFSAGIIEMGDATNAGGEIRNLAGDGAKDGTDAFTVEELNMHEYSNFYNGGDRGAISATNANAEVNWLSSYNGYDVNLSGESPVFDNWGKVGEDITVEGETGGLYEGIFNNNSGADVDAGKIFVRDYGLYYNDAGSDTDVTDTLQIQDTGIYYNDSTTDTEYLRIGEFGKSVNGGEFHNNSGGSLNVNNTGIDAGQIYIGNLFNQASSTELIVDGRLTIKSGNNIILGNMIVYDNAGITDIGELYVLENGNVSISEPVSIINSVTTGDLSISGTDASNTGLVTIENSEPGLVVKGATTVGNYGILDNLAGGSSLYGFDAVGLVSVLTNGTITSDISSGFYFRNGITSAGTTDLESYVLADENTISSYAIEVTGGTTSLSDSGSYVGDVISGNIMVSGGDFISYADLTVNGDLDVDGATTEAFFLHDSFPIDCQTTVTGYFDITSDATATVACENDPGFIVQSNSPGGNTQVEGTLILNTNLETETMVVGDGASASGTVTHDVVGNYGGAPATGGWHPNPADTCVLNVLDTLTINNNGAIDVSEKSFHRTAINLTGRGGSYGGKGQYVSGGNSEYGNISTWLDDFGQLGHSHYTFVTGMGTTDQGGSGGGIANISVGEDTDTIPDGIFDTGAIYNYGTIASNGANFFDGSGSGGSINIKTYTLDKDGSITAIGGDAVGTPIAADEHTAGGGGRIHIEYNDKSEFSGEVNARGGINDDSPTRYAGTGTIFYKWTDKWQNQNDGTLIVDAFLGSDLIDVDLDGVTLLTDYLHDATIPTEILDIESVQVDRYAGFLTQHGNTNTITTQQCVEANSGKLYIVGTTVDYNRNHGPTSAAVCHETPDPPATLYINDSTTGAQSGYVGTKADTAPDIPDITPVVSAIHEDAALNRTGTAETPTHDVYEYQLIIGSSVNNVWGDTAMTSCDIDSTRFPSDLDYAHNARTGDIIIPSACGANFSSGNTYYWKIRFMEDQDDNYATTTDQFWGLWSETNQFNITDGGVIAVGTCSAGTLAINLGNTPGTPAPHDKIINLPNDTADEEKCNITLESTSATGIHVMKNQTLTHTNATDTLTDMPAVETALGGNVGFYIDSISSGLFATKDPDNLLFYNFGWHQLRTATTQAADTKIITAASAIAAGSFDFWFGADISLDTIAGIYSAEATVILTDNNP